MSSALKPKAQWPGGRPNAAELAQKLRDLGVKAGAGILANAIIDDPIRFTHLLQNVGIHTEGTYTSHGDGSVEVEVRGRFYYPRPDPPHVHNWVIASVEPEPGLSATLRRVRWMCSNLRGCSHSMGVTRIVGAAQLTVPNHLNFLPQ